MENPRFPLKEFEAMFAGRFASREELLREYDRFCSVLTQLDEPVPELSAGQKADIFRQAWQGRPQARPGFWWWLALLRQPAVTFVLGIVLGCLLMSGGTTGGPDLVQPASAKDALTVERTRYTQVYAGAAVDTLYPELENAKMVVETRPESSTPQRVLYGTLDDGEVYVVWNL